MTSNRTGRRAGEARTARKSVVVDNASSKQSTESKQEILPPRDCGGRTPGMTAWSTKINTAWRRAVEDFFEAGDLLLAAKKELPHGEFLPMIRKFLLFGPRTAQRLMEIAESESLKCVRGTHL